MPVSDVFEELSWRGLVHQTTDPALPQRLNKESLTVYCGFDPTADSLAVHHLIALLNLRRFQRAGHKPIAVVGGGTGFIGDPSGKTEERKLLTEEILAKNVAGMRAQMEKFLDFTPGPTQAVLANNADWLCSINLIDFLRDTGKHFTINYMMEKESVRARLEDRSHGISYTEFSYMLLQAYDFYHLNKTYNCNLQIGGSDQFGNITAGTELIRRMKFVQFAKDNQTSLKETGKLLPGGSGPDSAAGLTTPLITRSDGKKFGKTEAGAVWLSKERTSVYEFYQFWINVPDTDVGSYLRYFTDLKREEVEAIGEESLKTPEKRIGQRKLATLMTEMVHGTEERINAEKTAAALFSGSNKGEGGLATLDEPTLLAAVKEAPSGPLDAGRLAGEGAGVLDLMAESKLWPSKGEARRAVQGGGAYLNDQRIADIGKKVTAAELLHGKYLIFRKGKKDYFLFKV